MIKRLAQQLLTDGPVRHSLAKTGTRFTLLLEGKPTQTISESGFEMPGSEIFFVPQQDFRKPAPKVALVASIAWTLWNYRLTLIQALERAGYEVLLIGGEDPARLKLEQQTGARFIPLKHINRRSLSFFKNFRLLAELFRLLRHHKPDVVLFFTIRPNTLGNLAAAAAGIPAISTIEGMGISGGSWWLRMLMQTMYRAALFHARKVIFLNRDDQHEFIQKRIVKSSRSLLIHGPGVDIDHFSPRTKTGKSRSIKFLFVARLLSEKGIREYAAAARQVKKEGFQAEFLVLGRPDPGNPTSIQPAEVEGWIREGILHYEGFVDDVRPAIAEADVLVLPSYYREGVPRSVLEGMSMGKMIITTDNVGCRDTVVDQYNGFLVPPRDVCALVESIKKVLRLPENEIRQMGMNSRKKTEAEFADAFVVPKYLALIQSLLVKTDRY